MHFLLGWFFASKAADAVGEIDRSSGNALSGILIWAILLALGAWGAHSNFGPGFAPYGAIAAFCLTSFYVLLNPSRSSFKMMMIASVSFILGIVAVINGGLLVLGFGYLLLSGEFKSTGLATVPWGTVGWATFYLLGSLLILGALQFLIERSAEQVRGTTNPDAA